MKVLKTFVHVLGDDGQYHQFRPEDEIPSWAADRIGDHCWEDEPDTPAKPKPVRHRAPAK